MNKTSLWRTSILLTLIAMFVPIARPAHAQVTELEPFWVVLERDTELRCGDSPSWYAVANLKQGQLLRVTAQSFEWYRVEYPRGTRVWIDTREARIIENGARVETTRSASPRALNAAVPTTDSSYRRVNMQAVVPPGTKFRYFGPIMNNQNQVDGYIVPAPEGAQGFVIAEASRRATEQEVRRFLEERDGQTEQPAPPAQETRPETQPTQPERREQTDRPAQRPTEQPIEQPVRPADEVQPRERDEEVIEPGDDLGTDDSESAGEAVEETETLSPMDVVIRRSRQLDEAYAEVAGQRTADAEIRPLIQEYRSLIELAEPTPLAADVARYAQARIDLLNIRLELQQAVEELEAIRSATGEAAESFGEIGEMLAGRREYILVGRLVPSAIYNGRRLPLMYRLQSVEGGSGRTLAYITPNEDIAIDSMLNAIVGVAGSQRRQGNSGVRIIEPVVIDVLRPGNR